MKIRYYLALCSAIIICAVIGIVIKFSVKSNEADIKSFQYFSMPLNASNLLSGKNGGELASSIDDLIQKTDIVIQGSLSSRSISQSKYYTFLNVKKVFKGNKNLLNRKIVISENINTSMENKCVNALNGFLPLKKGDDYILLLNKEDIGKYYSKDDIRNAIYDIITDSAFGQYRISGFKCLVVNSYVNKNYDELSETYDFIAKNQSSLDEYGKFRKQLLNKYSAT